MCQRLFLFARGTFQPTPNYNPGGGSGTYNNHPVGVFYIGARWAIFNQDLASMLNNAAFNVLVVKP